MHPVKLLYTLDRKKDKKSQKARVCTRVILLQTNDGMGAELC